METVQKSDQFIIHFTLPLHSGSTETASRSAWIVYLMFFLRGTFRIYTKTYTFSRMLCFGSEFFKLTGRIEHNMISVIHKLVKFFVLICRAENMHLFIGHFFRTESCFK